MTTDHDLIKPIPGMPGYGVTIDGRVWSYPKSWKIGIDRDRTVSHQGCWMRQFSSARGYVRVNLGVNCKKRSVHVHRLVALAWIPNPHNLPQVNHIDAVKSHNHASNLEWCTASQNKLHAHALGLCPVTEKFLASVRKNVLKAHEATRGKKRNRRSQKSEASI